MIAEKLQGNMQCLWFVWLVFCMCVGGYFSLFIFVVGFFVLFVCLFLNLVLVFSFSNYLEIYCLEDTAVLNIILFITSSSSNILPKPHCFCIKTSLELITWLWAAEPRGTGSHMSLLSTLSKVYYFSQPARFCEICTSSGMLVY